MTADPTRCRQPSPAQRRKSRCIPCWPDPLQRGSGRTGLCDLRTGLPFAVLRYAGLSSAVRALLIPFWPSNANAKLPARQARRFSGPWQVEAPRRRRGAVALRPSPVDEFWTRLRVYLAPHVFTVRSEPHVLSEAEHQCRFWNFSPGARTSHESSREPSSLYLYRMLVRRSKSTHFRTS